LDNHDTEKHTVGGLFFKKCLPVNKRLYTETMITREPFLSVYNLCCEKENDIIKSFNVYLNEYIAKQKVGKGFNFSTNIDLILKYIDENY
jgi:hypothetical protein